MPSLPPPLLSAVAKLPMPYRFSSMPSAAYSVYAGHATDTAAFASTPPANAADAIRTESYGVDAATIVRQHQYRGIVSLRYTVIAGCRQPPPKQKPNTEIADISSGKCRNTWHRSFAKCRYYTNKRTSRGSSNGTKRNAEDIPGYCSHAGCLQTYTVAPAAQHAEPIR